MTCQKGEPCSKNWTALLMDGAYQANETRQLVLDPGMIPVVPPKSIRVQSWEYDRNASLFVPAHCPA
jgi:hypothetical protein